MQLSLYTEKHTVIHHLGALTKIIYVFTSALVPIIIGTPWAFICSILINLLFVIVAKVLRQELIVLSFVALFLLSIVVVQGLVYSDNATVAFHVGNFNFYREGLLHAGKISLNVINIVLAFSLFVLTTKPSNMTGALLQLHFPPSVAYVFGSVFQIVPQMANSVSVIRDAQKSRGVEVEGNLIVRIKAFIPLISPVILNALVATKERAIALEVRGFTLKRKKTQLSQTEQTTAEKFLMIFLLGLLIFVCVWRVITWLS